MIKGADKSTKGPQKMRYDDVFKFGKHKGETVVHVLANDYRYLRWLYIKRIKTFDKEVMEAIKEYLESDERCYEISRAQGCYEGPDSYEQYAEWL